MGSDRVKNWLKEYQGLKFEYDTWTERQAQLVNQQYIPAMKMGNESMHTPSANDRMGNATARRIDFENETSEDIGDTMAKMFAIVNAIKALSDPMHRGVLIQRYIIGADGYRLKPWRLIAEKIYHRDDYAVIKSIQRLHREAINALEAITDNENNLIM